jgi:hypothetical protein
VSTGPAVTSAQTTIERVWPAHAEHKSGTRHARWSTAEGVVCACGDVLGWPDPEHHETYSQYTKRIAAERVDAASAPGRVKGAFGTYSRPTPEPEDGEPATVLPGADNAPEPGDYPEVHQPPAAHDDDPGPDEPEDAEVDWGEPPADEPEPEVLVIEDGDSEDVGIAPFPADAVPDERGNMISGGMSYGPADEAQAVVPSGHGWNDGERTDAAEIADGSQAEYAGQFARPNACPGEVLSGQRLEVVSPCPLDREKPSDDWSGDWCHIHEGYGPRVTQDTMDRELDDTPPEIPKKEIGRDLVPYAGTPIMPTKAEHLDPLNSSLAPLDPTRPYTPADVELKIVAILQQLENSELFLRQQLSRLHQATHNYNMRYNLAYKTSDGRSDGQRKADAVLATERESYEMTEAEMLVRALRDSQHNLRAQLSGFQSVARSLAVSMVNSLDGRDRPSLPPEPPRYP